jgi:hypothetical protein
MGRSGEISWCCQKPRLGFSTRFSRLHRDQDTGNPRNALRKFDNYYPDCIRRLTFTEVTPEGRTSTRTIDDQGRTVHVQPSCCEAPCTFDVSMCTTCCYDAGGIDASQDLFDAGVDMVQDAAADAGGDASADAGQADCIPDGNDCPSGYWCRPTYPRGGMECVPFVGEGESCEGHVTTPEKCKPGLDCLTGLDDYPGICIVLCSDNADCGTGRFCSPWYQACIDNGSCIDSLDCDNPDNAYAHMDCEGYGTCNGRTCTWTCGNAACRDITSVDLNIRCYGFLGFAVFRGECTAINRGCDGRGLTFYEDEDACQATCIP